MIERILICGDTPLAKATAALLGDYAIPCPTEFDTIALLQEQFAAPTCFMLSASQILEPNWSVLAEQIRPTGFSIVSAFDALDLGSNSLSSYQDALHRQAALSDYVIVSEDYLAAIAPGNSFDETMETLLRDQGSGSGFIVTGKNNATYYYAYDDLQSMLGVRAYNHRVAAKNLRRLLEYRNSGCFCSRRFGSIILTSDWRCAHYGHSENHPA